MLAGKPNVRVLVVGALAIRRRFAISNIAAWSAACWSRRATPRRRSGAPSRIVTQRKPTPTQYADLWFAWRVCKYVKSNAIVFARDGRPSASAPGR